MDLDGDSYIGIDLSSITLKTSDTTGDKIAVTSDGSLYIAKENGDYVEIIELEWKFHRLMKVLRME